MDNPIALTEAVHYLNWRGICYDATVLYVYADGSVDLALTGYENPIHHIAPTAAFQMPRMWHTFHRPEECPNQPPPAEVLEREQHP